MGAHWAWLGFADVDALVAEARGTASGQARLMARYIEKAGLSAAIHSHDWEAFARGYNGPAYKRFSYHQKLAAAYQRHSGTVADPRPAKGDGGTPAILQKGATGSEVSDLQRTLSALGYPLDADGIFGKDTERAVRAFQSDYGLPEDGMAGPMTLAAIAKAMPFGAAGGGWWRSTVEWVSGFFGRG